MIRRSIGALVATALGLGLLVPQGATPTGAATGRAAPRQASREVAALPTLALPTLTLVPTTRILPTATLALPTLTAVPLLPTATRVPPTATRVPPTATPILHLPAPTTITYVLPTATPALPRVAPTATATKAPTARVPGAATPTAHVSGAATATAVRGTGATPVPSRTAGAATLPAATSTAAAAAPSGTPGAGHATTVRATSSLGRVTLIALPPAATPRSGRGSPPGRGSGALSALNAACRSSVAAPVRRARRPARAHHVAAAQRHKPARARSAALAGRAQPALRVALSSSLVRPGAIERVRVSYVEAALVQARLTVPGRGSLALYKMTDARGRLTLAVKVPANTLLCNGHASIPIQIRAASGPWDRLMALSTAVYRGYTERIVVSTLANAPVRVAVTFPRQHSRLLFDTTDNNGLSIVEVTVPRALALHHDSAVAHVEAWVMRVRRHATATGRVRVSDMVVGVQGGRIVGCAQTQVIHVAYRPGARLRILVLAGVRRVTLAARADRHGDAWARLRLSYAGWHNPARIVVQASDAAPHSRRSERVVMAIALPKRC